jgi:hypothetical protein
MELSLYEHCCAASKILFGLQIAEKVTRTQSLLRNSLQTATHVIRCGT